MTKHFEIINTVSGMNLGVFEADDEQGALDAMARDAGFPDHAAACRAFPVGDGELRVREVEEDEEEDEEEDLDEVDRRIVELLGSAATAEDAVNFHRWIREELVARGVEDPEGMIAVRTDPTFLHLGDPSRDDDDEDAVAEWADREKWDSAWASALERFNFEE
jgi:hypothetical protein